MNYKIDLTLHTPAYLQLYRQLRADIVDGEYPFGARLPSKRLISEELGVSIEEIMLDKDTSNVVMAKAKEEL